MNKPVRFDGGVDAKWTPNANNAIDATLNPDFSQVESDVAQIVTNQRFALFYPEKRPFFLEGAGALLLPHPGGLHAEHHVAALGSPGDRASSIRTSTPRFVAEDRGGGSVILPGSNGSGFADQDFSSFVAHGARAGTTSGSPSSASSRPTARSAAAATTACTGRTSSGAPAITTRSPASSSSPTRRRPTGPTSRDQWTGQKLDSHAADVWYSHSTGRGTGSRSSRTSATGSAPTTASCPRSATARPTARRDTRSGPRSFPISRLRTFLQADYQADTGGNQISRSVSPGFGMDGLWNSFTRLRYAYDRVRSGNTTFPRRQLVYQFQVSPPRWITQFIVQGTVGEQIDFDNSRPGSGADVNMQATIRPTDHLKLDLVAARSWVNVDPRDGRRLPAPLHRGRGTGEGDLHVHVARVPAPDRAARRDAARSLDLHVRGDRRKDADFTGSALFAYKLNWQTVMFLGYGDNRTLLEDDRYAKAGHQFFLKLSYAFRECM